MTETNIALMHGQERSHWIRLRTLTMLRWVAITGQLTAILVAQQYFSLSLYWGPCYAAVGVSIVGNLIATFVFPENKRLSEFENFLMVLFDLLQLSFLLYFSGGLHNPFAVLLLGPVTISASVLALRSTLLIGGTAIVLVTLLAEFHQPLRTEQGFILRIPDIFVFGDWVAIVIASLFIGAYSRKLSSEIRSMSDALAATQLALSREQKLTDLGGVVAAAAHELGTPLATIKLTSAELMEELEDRPELHDDAALIREQADRCRDILRSMGRAGKDDLHMRHTPLSALLDEAAEPHLDRGKTVHFDDDADFDREPDAIEEEQPSVLRKPEVIHGLRNLIQNAVDFAQENVWIDTRWNGKEIVVRIADDGSGYPPMLLGRIGDPFVRKRRAESERSTRPGYEGMGLGLFIAKTLLERSGAELTFANGTDPYFSGDGNPVRTGAIVNVRWPREALESPPPRELGGLGQNTPIST